jgi:hypothetical protein
VSVGQDFPVLGDAWWIVLTTSTNPQGQPGSGFIIVHGTQQQVYARYGGPSDVKGPYATQAEAEAAAKKDVGPGPGNISSTPPGAPQLGNLNPAAAIFAVGHWLGDIVTHLTDIYMWRSMGWLLLGIVFIISAIALLMKDQLSGEASALKGIL